MNKKTYLYTGVAVIIIIIAGLYIQYRSNTSNKQVSDTEQLNNATQELNQDMDELSELEDDSALNDLDQDLSNLAEDQGNAAAKPTAPKIDVSSVENLDSELDNDLSTLSEDVSDLNNLGNDSSLDNLDSLLSDF